MVREAKDIASAHKRSTRLITYQTLPLMEDANHELSQVTDDVAKVIGTYWI